MHLTPCFSRVFLILLKLSGWYHQVAPRNIKSLHVTSSRSIKGTPNSTHHSLAHQNKLSPALKMSLSRSDETAVSMTTGIMQEEIPGENRNLFSKINAVKY